MVHQIAKPEVQRLKDSGAQVVDVLPKKEYFERHIPGAISLPLTELDAKSAERLDRARPIVVYCNDDT